jgi:ElaB/YqjD/DUF883 family membrane-anchored ribosome-binding protein
MTDSEDKAGDALATAAKRAQDAIGAAKDNVAGTDLDQLRAKAGDAAGALYRSGRDLLANTPELDKAKDDLKEQIRSNPLAAVGIAFTAGLLIALLTRG